MLGRLISSLLRTRRSADALCAEGAALFSAGRLVDAVTFFEEALASEPDCVPAHAGLGAALQKLGDRERALPHLMRAADADPSARGLNLMVGQLLLRTGEAREARARLARAAAAHPEDADLAYHLAIATRDAGDEEGAHEQLERLTTRCPEHAAALEALAALLRDAGRVPAAAVLYARVAELRPDLPSAHSALLFHEQYVPHDRGTLFRKHVQWGRRFAASTQRSWPRRDADPARALVVGYVSADFNASSAVQFIEPILRSHDRSAFRIACYAASSRSDAVTRRLKGHADLWRDIDGLDDAAAQGQIEADEVDLLVDLNGHTRGGRLTLFGRRPAPVQVTYLGYGATTGVAAMDYRLTDRFIDPPGASEHYYVERLVRLPHTMWCFAPPAGAPPVSGLPAEKTGALTFASLNNFSKATDECLAAWARVLAACACARMLMLGVPDGPARRRALEAFAAHGVEGSRLVFHARQDFARYLELHGEIDIGLDTFPYTGGATTCNALWMGVPMLTLEGDAVLARSGASLLGALGLQEWVAGSIDEYVASAIRFAGNRHALAQLRSGLRARLAASSLCDAAGFTRSLESAYRDMWQAWCRNP